MYGLYVYVYIYIHIRMYIFLIYGINHLSVEEIVTCKKKTPVIIRGVRKSPMRVDGELPCLKMCVFFPGRDHQRVTRCQQSNHL